MVASDPNISSEVAQKTLEVTLNYNIEKYLNENSRALLKIFENEAIKADTKEFLLNTVLDPEEPFDVIAKILDSNDLTSNQINLKLNDYSLFFKEY